MSGETKIIQPNVKIAVRGVSQELSVTPHRVLVVGQMLAGGSAVSGELQKEIGNDNSWDTLFDEKSMLASTVRAFKGSVSAPLNRVTRIDGIGLGDAAGSEATGHVIFGSGPATADGTIVVDIGSKRDHSYKLAFTSSDDITDIGDALEALITADSKRQASGANASGDVTITAEHKGTVGNGIGIRVTGSIPGVTIAVTAMSGGATDPTLTTLFDVVVDTRYQTIIYPSNWDLSVLTDFLDPRFNTSGLLLDGFAVISLTDTFSNLGTVLDAENSQSLGVHCNKIVDDTLYKGSSVFELDYAIAAQFAAIRAMRLTDGVSISSFVIGEAALDQFGGVHISSKPYFNTPYSHLPIIPIGKGFTSGEGSEIKILEDKGGFVLGNNIAGNSIIAGAVVTTYKTDAASNPDLSFKYLNAVDTATAIREFYFNNSKATYAQSRLTDGDLIPRVASANENSVRAFLTGLYVRLTEPEFSLTRSGEVNLAIFKDKLKLTLDLATGGVSGESEFPIVGQFRNFTFVIKIRF
jgi:phage tail sheath gpL-like